MLTVLAYILLAVFFGAFWPFFWQLAGFCCRKSSRSKAILLPTKSIIYCHKLSVASAASQAASLTPRPLPMEKNQPLPAWWTKYHRRYRQFTGREPSPLDAEHGVERPYLWWPTFAKTNASAAPSAFKPALWTPFWVRPNRCTPLSAANARAATCAWSHALWIASKCASWKPPPALGYGSHQQVPL